MTEVSSRIAIAGIDILFADCAGIDEFDRCLYRGEQRLSQKPDDRALKLASTDLPDLPWLQQTSISPASLCENMLAEISRQSGIAAKAMRVMVVNTGLSDEETGKGDIADERRPLKDSVSELYQFNTLMAAIEQARTLLVADEDPVIILGYHVLADSLTIAGADVEQNHSLLYDENMKAYLPGEGGAALLLMTEDQAKKQNRKIYAFLDGTASAKLPEQAFTQALKNTRHTLQDLAYVEVTTPEDENKRAREWEGLKNCFPIDGEPNCALGSIKALVGDSGGFSEVAGLLKLVLATYHRYVPGVADWHAPKQSEEWKTTRFYIPTESRSWYLENEQTKRVAAYSIADKSAYHFLIVSENDADTERSNGYLAEMPIHLFPVSAKDTVSLGSALDDLLDLVESESSMRKAAEACYETYLKNHDSEYALVILGDSKEDICKEIALMKSGFKEALEKGVEWKTPKGSYFTPEPVGRDAGVAFVYPGVGAAYVGLGRDLFHLFPGAYNATEAMSRDIGAMLKDRTINPRSQTKLSFKELKQLDLQLRHNLVTISECGVGFAYVFSRIFQQLLGIQPDFAFGYSMGEVSMFTAMDCWQDPGCLSARLAASPTFNYGLTGEMRTLRKHWEVDETDTDKKLWETYTLKGTIEEVSAACDDEEHVYITIINTPDSVLIGGDPAACERVIKKLGVRGMAMEIPSAIHSEPAFKEYENMEKLYTLETGNKVSTKLYSTSCYLPVPQRTKAIANSIAKCFCEQVDFPRLVNTVYDKGARVFLEMGAGRSCSSWIDKILKHDGENKPHVAIPVNAKGTEDHLTIARCMAKLVSHRVDVDISSFYYGSMLQYADEHNDVVDSSNAVNA